MKKRFLIAVGTLIFITACVKDSFDFSKLGKSPWNPNLAIPLAHSKLTIYDIIKQADKDSNIIVDNTNFCTLVYKDRLFSLKANEIINIPDQSFNNNLSLSLTQVNDLINNGTVTANFTQTINYASGTTEIDSIIYKLLTLNIYAQSNFNHNASLVVTIPSAKKNGNSFQATIPINANATSNTNYDMSGYSFDMTLGGTTHNQFQINYALTLTYSGNPVNTTNNVAVQISFNNNQFDRIYGYIDQIALSPYEDSVLVKIFNNSFGSGSFRLVDPYMDIRFNNSFGVPISGSFAYLKGYNPISNTSFDISSSSGVPNPLNIPTPTVVGQTATGGFTLTNANTSGLMTDMINEQPKFIIYKLNSFSNTPPPANRNFVIDTSQFTIDMNLYLPLHGRAFDFVFQDTLDFKFDRINEIDNVLFRTYINNGFPVDINVQVYFAYMSSDTLNPTISILDSLVVPTQIFMRSASIDATSGKVTAPTEKTTDVYADRVKLARISGANKLLIRATGASTNNGNTNVKIYSDYILEVKLGVQTQVNTQF
ncbi:MAG: hypothetical protein ACK4IK_07950 [Bacteroidia bacterium]